MNETDILSTLRDHLFEDTDKLREAGFRQSQIDRIVRVRDMYQWWLQYPTKREREVVAEIVARYAINRSSAYRDVAVLRSLLSDLGKLSKDFIRWQFNAMVTEAYAQAKQRGDHAAMIAAADKYAKYNQLDKADSLDIQWDKIVPQPFEVSDDPTVIGFKPIKNLREKIKAKISQYWNDGIEDIRPADISLPSSDGHGEEVL